MKSRLGFFEEDSFHGFFEISDREFDRIEENSDNNLFRFSLKFLKFDSVTVEETYSILLPYVETGNDFLNQLWQKFPNHSDKQSEWWHRLMGGKYYLNETHEGREIVDRSEECMYWLTMIVQNDISLGLNDINFIPRFYTTAKKTMLAKGRLSEKQMAVIEKWRHKYRKQLNSLVVSKI